MQYLKKICQKLLEESGNEGLMNEGKTDRQTSKCTEAKFRGKGSISLLYSEWLKKSGYVNDCIKISNNTTFR